MIKPNYSICIGIGDFIMWRGYMDTIKDQCSKISLSPALWVLEQYRHNDPAYLAFLQELGHILFSDPPYCFTLQQFPFRYQQEVVKELKIIPQPPYIPELLCKGIPLSINEPYIVVNMKVRFVDKCNHQLHFRELGNKLYWLSKKYTIVLLGERQVEPAPEYIEGTNINEIFSLYPYLRPYLPESKEVLDLTVPALGITIPDIIKIQQDCLIMRDAAACINIGIGGGLALSMAVSQRVMGYRTDQDPMANLLFALPHPRVCMTRDWRQFIQMLDSLAPHGYPTQQETSK